MRVGERVIANASRPCLSTSQGSKIEHELVQRARELTMLRAYLRARLLRESLCGLNAVKKVVPSDVATLRPATANVERTNVSTLEAHVLDNVVLKEMIVAAASHRRVRCVVHRVVGHIPGGVCAREWSASVCTAMLAVHNSLVLCEFAHASVKKRVESLCKRECGRVTRNRVDEGNSVKTSACEVTHMTSPEDATPASGRSTLVCAAKKAHLCEAQGYAQAHARERNARAVRSLNQREVVDDVSHDACSSVHEGLDGPARH